MDVIKADPAVAHVNAYTGGNGSSNGGFIYIALKPLGQERRVIRHGGNQPAAAQDESDSDSVGILQPGTGSCASAAVRARLSTSTRSRQTMSATCFTGVPILLANMKKLPGLLDVNTDQQNGGLQEMLTYDRVTAARLGQTSQSLDQSLYRAFGQSEVSVIYTQLNQYYVVMEVAPRFWQSPARSERYLFRAVPRPDPRGLGSMLISPLVERDEAPDRNHTPAGQSHRLVSFCDGVFQLWPWHVAQRCNPRSGAHGSQLGMPSTVHGFFAGTAQAYQESLATEKYFVITALLAVFIVLGILYESLIHPLTIISTLPSASVGAMLALMLFQIDLNVISIIGIILLIGIVKKNAIMMIDFALMAERKDGKSTYDAIFEACMLRFRPIMMTTTAAICGALPLAFGTGTGSE